MTKAEVLQRVRAQMRKHFAEMESAHDWSHIERVVRIAKQIARKEKADLFIVELGALLHDIADWKFHGGDTSIGPKKARELLTKLRVAEKVIVAVEEIVGHISYRGGTNTHVMQTIEGKVVQDADRLDAIGAIGIARVFAFGGSMGRPIHADDVKGKKWKSFKAYQKRSQTSIAHFYEKLLLLKDLMNTKTGKQIALKRHQFLKSYLKQFLLEWKG